MDMTVADVRSKAGEAPIVMLTAYDALTATIADEAGVDIILVGDSMGNTVLGYESTLPVTVDEIASRTAAAVRATDDALVVADMPFLSFGVDDAQSIRNAGRMVKEAGAAAVKLESGPHTVELTERLVELGIPVMAHLGLRPQHVNQLGGYRRQGTDRAAAERMLSLARDHDDAGAFSLVLEHIPSNLAASITEAVDIPTIGIGAGPSCDGQVLVFTDVVGLSEHLPPFARAFGDARRELKRATTAYVDAVSEGRFPEEEHSVTVEELEGLDDLY